MKETDACALLESGVVLGFVSILTILLLACANLPWQLEDYDQAKQAFTSWQMVKSGRLLYQETPVGRVATKPPLTGWISAAIFELTRSWDVAWRLPSLACAGLIATGPVTWETPLSRKSQAISPRRNTPTSWPGKLT